MEEFGYIYEVVCRIKKMFAQSVYWGNNSQRTVLLRPQNFFIVATASEEGLIFILCILENIIVEKQKGYREICTS